MLMLMLGDVRASLLHHLGHRSLLGRKMSPSATAETTSLWCVAMIHIGT